jgi:hypothetical protein
MIKKLGGVFKESKERKAKKYDIFVVRINKCSDEVKLVNSRPCSHCLDMMKAVGIRRVYYTDDSGEIINENVKDMISIHTSKVTQRFEITKNKSKTAPLIKQNQINQTEYYDKLIEQIPNVIKQTNYKYFIEYNWKTISQNYRLESKPNTNSGYTWVNIINISGIILKTICVI